MTMRFIIKDWVGNILFEKRRFNSFEEGWGFIYETDPIPAENDPRYDEHWYDDYYVEPLETK